MMQLKKGVVAKKINGSNYYVLNDGQIYSEKSERFLKKRKDHNGYEMVNLYINGKSKTFKVHRLVAEYFVENPNKYNEVNHINENKSDNNAENLEWCTHKHNANYGTKLERTSIALRETFRDKTRTPWYGKHITENMKIALSKNAKTYTGANNPRARAVVCADTGKVFETATQAAEFMNCNASAIRYACKGTYKTAGGYHWKYACIDEILGKTDGSER